jgi:hypothetical protein
MRGKGARGALDLSPVLRAYSEPSESPCEDVSDEKTVFGDANTPGEEKELTLPAWKSVSAGLFAGCKDQRLDETARFVIAFESGVSSASPPTLGCTVRSTGSISG